MKIIRNVKKIIASCLLALLISCSSSFDEVNVSVFLDKFNKSLMENDFEQFISYFSVDVQVSGEFNTIIDGEKQPAQSNAFSYQEFKDAMQYSLNDPDIKMIIEVLDQSMSYNNETNNIVVQRQIKYSYVMPFGKAVDYRDETISLMPILKNDDANIAPSTTSMSFDINATEYQVVKLHVESNMSVITALSAD